MKNITDLNRLFYTGAKLTHDKIGDPQRNLNRKTNPGWEFKQELEVNKWRELAKKIRKENNTRIFCDENFFKN